MDIPPRITVITAVRTLLGVALLCSSMSAVAQPVIGPEVVSGRLAASAAPSVAMARDRSGVVIAWNMPANDVERVYLSRLDATGHAIGSTVIAPVAMSASDAYGASIAAAPDGDGFVLAWLETPRFGSALSTLLYCELDSALQPSTPVVLASLLPAPVAPPIVRSGASTWITAAPRLWKIRGDGVVEGPTEVPFIASDMTIADTPQLIAMPDTVQFRMLDGCVSPATCQAEGGVAVPSFCRSGVACRVSSHTAQLQFLALLWTNQTLRFDFAGRSGAAAIENNGRETLVVWLNGPQKGNGDVVAARLEPAERFSIANATSQVIGRFTADDEPSRPDIAADGERFVIVWRARTADGTHDIAGVALDREGRVTALQIPSTPGDERDPSVIAIGNGTFLVGYEQLESGERHIAGRLISFGARHRIAE
jgi:hypothetical protein